MRIIICLFCLLFVANGFAQSKIVYFPQEQLIHPDLPEQKDPSVYLHEIVKNKMITLLSQKKSLNAIKKHGKDTTNVVLSFQVDPEGFVIQDKVNVSVNSGKLWQKFDKKLSKVIFGLPKFKVSNRKSETYNSIHFLPYRFVVQGKKELEIKYVPSKDTYAGGVIQEIPVFPGCENLSQKEAILCFQEKMQDHISSHFIYPPEAAINNISGRVNIVFIISKEGNITNIEAKGPHKLLENEAIRIIEFLPKMEPGKQNGEPIKIPYSIPITFSI
ncbi:energy transducer TonB [uncultured Allomuricauda sp.]|uniref:energy transducer TonB n=1 Tax=Flagellimonas sp. W118 TaxID=3410791 RepID=UPI002614CFE8|nr:energy transducer TonB [uncultured Allomuricauda sp.]